MPRGGSGMVTAIDAAITLLRSRGADHQGAPTTKAETEQLDILDGIIVTRARLMRDAADAAARALGESAIADAFELVKLNSKTTQTPPTIPPKDGPKPA